MCNARVNGKVQNYGFVLQPVVKLLAKCRMNEGVESGKLKVAYLAVDVIC